MPLSRRVSPDVERFGVFREQAGAVTVAHDLVRVLTDAGFRVLVAATGHEALARLTSLGASVVWLVVSEFAMPGMTEGELASTIIAQWPEIPLLLVSDRPPAGWDGPFLARPFSPEALATAVKDLLPPAERPIGGRHA